LDCLILNTKRRSGRNVGNYTSKQHNAFSQENRVFSNAAFRALNFEMSTYLPFFFFCPLSAFVRSAPFEHPLPPRTSFTRSNPRSTTEEYKLYSQSLSRLYSLPISLILERTSAHKTQKEAHPPYPESLPSRLCDTSDILTQNRFYLAPHQEVRVFTSLGRVRISNCHGMSVCSSGEAQRVGSISTSTCRLPA